MNFKGSFCSLTLAIWGVLALTAMSGVFLLVYYIPAFSQAFASVEKINDQVPFGWLMRHLHAVGGSFLLILLFFHLLRIFYSGAYKDRSKLAWIVEIFLFFFALGMNFTGFLLPLSQKAFWGTTAVLSSFSTLPWFGSPLVEFIRGGRELGGSALARFFSMHIGMAALMVGLLWAHSRLGRSPNNSARKGSSEQQNLWIIAVVGAFLLVGITVVPHWFMDPLKEAANPTVIPSGVPAPWYFFFLQEILSFANTAYPIWSTLILGLIFLLPIFLPYIDRNPEVMILLRPLSLAVGSALLVIIVYFNFLGMAGANYGEKVILAENPTSREFRGAQIFAKKNCSYCHQVLGKYGRREGPDMAAVIQRRRAPEWIQRFLLNARLYQAGSTMPKYELPLEDLEALRAYLLSLDPERRNIQAVKRENLFAFEPSLRVVGEEKK